MLPLTVFLTLLSALVLFAGVAMLAGLGEGGPSAKGVGGIVVGSLMGFISVTSLVTHWLNRKSSISIDETGLWVSTSEGQGVIAWHLLAGVGLHWSKFGRRNKVYSIELCPNVPIDRDAPVLWPLVRDEEPLHPTLPRLRYRLPVTAGSREPLVAAVRAYVPQLWLGESERATGHIGTPDRKGHRERTRGRS